MVVDSHPDRLKLAEELGAIPIDFSKGSAVEQVLELPKAWVLIRVANAWGTSVVTNMARSILITMNELVQAVKATGSIGVVGVLFPRS
jgi:threonine dehydrogenase-like Zn-dependent dehydrogenase